MLAPRLAGVKSDGSIKIRSVDDVTASSANQAAKVREKLSYDTLDTLLETLRIMDSVCEAQRPSSCWLRLFFPLDLHSAT